MAIVAITREMGSFGTHIGMEVAARLGYAFVREDITREAAREYDVREDRLVEVIEERPGLFEAMTRSVRRYQAFVAAAVLEAAVRDRVVIVGRWSTFLLDGIRHAVRVRVCGPEEARAARVETRLGVDRAEALERIRKYDAGVRARVRHVFEADWRDPLQYALTINTGQVSLESGVAQVLALVHAPEFQPTDASRGALQDRTLAARVRAALKADRKTSRLDLGVRAADGAVTLAGTAGDAADVEAALAVARVVEGVTGASSEVQVVRMPG
jgi:hyperosmotically inducible periplasmic protein